MDNEANVLSAIRRHVWAGTYDAEEIALIVGEELFQPGQAHNDWLQARAEEATWPAVTDCSGEDEPGADIGRRIKPGVDTGRYLVQRDGKELGMAKRLIAGCLLVLALVVALVMTSALRNPLRESPEQIRKSLLRMAPLGSEPEQVRAALNSAKLRHYPGRKDGDMFWRYRLDHGGAGETAICSDLGTYTNLGENGFIPWTVFVRALWVFDADDRLVDVDVWKIIDCP